MGSKRRLIAYIILAVTMFVSVIVSATAVFTSLNPGREYTNGYQFVYQLRNKDVAEDESYVVEDTDAAEKVAKEMRARLDTYQVEDYSVIVEGNDQVRVAISEKDETKLNYIRRYLAFSGGNFSLAGKVEETRVDGIFDGVEAYIVRQQDLIPYVIIPVSDTQKVKTLIQTVTDTGGAEASEKNPFRHAEGEEGDEHSSEPDIFLWANWEEGDSYDVAMSDPSYTGQKILLSFVSSNIWYQDSDEEETELQYLCGFATAEDSTQYDVTKLKQANQLATFYVNMFNASSYDYDVVDLFVTESASGINYNTVRSDASLENILVYGTDVDIAWSATFYSSILAILIVSLILAYFYRLSAIGMAANTVSTVFLTYLLFSVMGATFNVSAFVGGILLAVSSLVTEIIYAHYFKQEVYKGRTLKKANQEATKKLNLISIDVAVPTFVVGLFLYFIGGSALKPLGIMLFFGAVIALVMNLVVFRLLNYLLTNTTALANNYKAFNIVPELVPTSGDEEKEIFEGAYKDHDFTKHKKPISIVAAILLVASIAGSIIFGIINGSSLNVSRANRDYSEVYTSIRGENVELDTVEKFEENVLKYVYNDGNLVKASDIDIQYREEYNYKDTVTTYYTYFVTRFDSVLDVKNVTYKIGEQTFETETLEDAISAVVINYEGTTNAYVDVSLKTAHETVVTPNQGLVILATAIGVIVSGVYFMFRYRPSKGISALLVSVGSSTITYGILVLTRLQTTAISVIVVPVVALFSLLLSVMFMAKTNELYAEEKDLSLEKRRELGVKATALAATPALSLSAVTAYIAIDFFGFAPANLGIIFAGMLIGVILSLALSLTLGSVITNVSEKVLGNIHLPKIKTAPKREKIKLTKKNSSEPEETIIIGIND